MRKPSPAMVAAMKKRGKGATEEENPLAAYAKRPPMKRKKK